MSITNSISKHYQEIIRAKGNLLEEHVNCSVSKKLNQNFIMKIIGKLRLKNKINRTPLPQ